MTQRKGPGCNLSKRFKRKASLESLAPSASVVHHSPAPCISVRSGTGLLLHLCDLQVKYQHCRSSVPSSESCAGNHEHIWFLQQSGSAPHYQGCAAAGAALERPTHEHTKASITASFRLSVLDTDSKPWRHRNRGASAFETFLKTFASQRRNCSLLLQKALVERAPLLPLGAQGEEVGTGTQKADWCNTGL